jgi:DNA (cytosine-5)-methyltransferase 1
METSNKLTGEQLSLWTSSAVDIPANHSAPQASDKEQTTQDTYGHGLEQPLASYDPDTQSWRTSEDISLLGGLQVIGELAEIGYDAEWRVVSAAGVGAPHRRDRIIIVAYPDSTSRQQQLERQVQKSNIGRCSSDVADSCEQQFNGRGHQHSSGTVEERQTVQEPIDRSSSNVANTKGSAGGVTQSHGLRARIWKATELGESDSTTRTLGDWWEVEPDMGRVADGIPNRVDRLRGLGNAVVPQVAEYIGRLITTSLDA